MCRSSEMSYQKSSIHERKSQKESKHSIKLPINVQGPNKVRKVKIEEHFVQSENKTT